MAPVDGSDRDPGENNTPRGNPMLATDPVACSLAAYPPLRPMPSLPWNADRRHAVEHAVEHVEATNHCRLPAAPAPASVLNTVLAVREHAPAEIAELERDIQTLHHRLGAAYARKRLLEQLMRVIQEADAEAPSPLTAMTVLR